MDEQKKKKPFYKKWWFIAIIFIVVIGAFNSGGDGTDDQEVAQNSDGKTVEQKEGKSQTKSNINYENFLAIEMGLTLDDVVALLGKEGTEDTSSEIAGMSTAMYSWSEGLSNMNVTVQDGIIIGKAQVGLKEASADVDMEKYNNIKNGMSLSEVQDILGEGELTSDTKIMNMESSMYSWINSFGTNINCTFSDGKLIAKAQFGLE